MGESSINPQLGLQSNDRAVIGDDFHDSALLDKCEKHPRASKWTTQKRVLIKILMNQRRAIILSELARFNNQSGSEMRSASVAFADASVCGGDYGEVT